MTNHARRLSLLSFGAFLLPALVACSGGTTGGFSSESTSASSTTGSGGAGTSSSTSGGGGATGSGGTSTTSTTTGSGGGTSTSTTTSTTTTTTSSSGGMLDNFSFFVTSLKAMQELSGSAQGFGGDLRFGEVGQGAGLRGADKICTAIAEKSMPGSGAKQWHAFLSAVAGENGSQVDAIDRIGEGPWYDRLGRVVAANKADLMHDRPSSADATIKNDFPNEDGVPNHAPDPAAGEVDNHDTLTGTNSLGKLYGPSSTCLDWTGGTGNKATEGKPHVGHSWPRFGGPMMGGLSNMANWMSSLDESGCAPGVNLIEMGPPNPNSNTVGSGGGYGAIYCFAMTP
jgi:hypothetical protein